MSNKAQYFVAGISAFLVFLLFYGVTGRGKFQASDEVAVFCTGVSLATRGELAIDQLDWLQEMMNIGQRGRDGHLYAKYFPGNAFCAAAVYGLTARPNDEPCIWNRPIAFSSTGARWCTRINAVWGALGMTALLLLLRRYFGWGCAIATVVLIGFCSDWWYQSRGFFSEVGAGALLVTALCFLTYEKVVPAAAALAASILFRPTNLIALPMLGKGAGERKWKTLAASGIVLGGVVVLGIYNRARFGSPFVFGYGEERFDLNLFRGLYGVLFSPGRSVFLYSPILLLAIPGAFLFYAKDKRLTIICAFVIGLHALVIAAWHSWDGGVSWGSRLLTPILPLAAVLLAPTIDLAWRKKWLIAPVLLLGAVGFGIQVLALMRDPTHVLVDRMAQGQIQYEDTLFTVRESWLALQIRAAPGFQPCDLDSVTLRYWLTNCSR